MRGLQPHRASSNLKQGMEKSGFGGVYAVSGMNLIPASSNVRFSASLTGTLDFLPTSSPIGLQGPITQFDVQNKNHGYISICCVRHQNLWYCVWDSCNQCSGLVLIATWNSASQCRMPATPGEDSCSGCVTCGGLKTVEEIFIKKNSK